MARKSTGERQPYWVRFYFGRCPICNEVHGYRRRVEGTRPKRRRRIYLSYLATQRLCVGG